MRYGFFSNLIDSISRVKSSSQEWILTKKEFELSGRNLKNLWTQIRFGMVGPKVLVNCLGMSRWDAWITAASNWIGKKFHAGGVRKNF